MRFILISACLALTSCAGTWSGLGGGAASFDRPGLLALADASVRPELERADSHILVVRHARKTSPDCNEMNCQLSPRGEAMVARLARLLADAPVNSAYASAACRTMMTAAAGGAPVIAHRAGDSYPVGCEEGVTIERLRAEAFNEAADARWSIAGEHSSTVCLWMTEFAGDEAAAGAGCVEGRVDHHDYGHVYWLYRVDGAWQLTVLEGVFEVENA